MRADHKRNFYSCPQNKFRRIPCRDFLNIVELENSLKM